MKKFAQYLAIYVVTALCLLGCYHRYQQTQAWTCNSPLIVIHKGETIEGQIRVYCRGNIRNAVDSVMELNHIVDPMTVQPDTVLRTR